jgi:hypothetical protein
MSMDSQTDFNPKGLIFGLLLPGAGHMATGQVPRGLLVALGVLGLFVGGIFIGGIDVIDSEEDRVWFLGQAFVGPLAFGIDQAHQHYFKAYDPAMIRNASTTKDLDKMPRRSAYPEESKSTATITVIDSDTRTSVSRTLPVWSNLPGGSGPPNKKSISKVNELGTLFATIAGMMNIIAVLDAAFPSNRRKLAATSPAGAKP